MKKFFILTAFLLSSLFSAAEEVYICVGSFLVKDSAKETVKILKENSLDAFISGYCSPETIPPYYETRYFYRVLVKTECNSEKEIEDFKAGLYENPGIKKLRLKDFWRCRTINPLKDDGETAGTDFSKNTPESVAEPEPVSEPETITEPEPVTEPETITEPEPAAEPKTIIEPEPFIEPEPEPEPVTNIKPVTDIEPVKTPSPSETEAAVPGTSEEKTEKKPDYEYIKIVLDWNFEPEDLDCHIICGKHHVFFGNKTEYGMKLARDDSTGYGPEIVIIREPKAEETYEFYVHNFSETGNSVSDSLSYSGAQVRVYFNSEKECSTYKITKGKPGTIWHVFDIKNKNEITLINEISSESFIEKFLVRINERNELLKKTDTGDYEEQDSVKQKTEESPKPVADDEDYVIKYEPLLNEDSAETSDKSSAEEESSAVWKAEEALTVFEEDFPVIETEPKIEYRIESTPGNVK